MVFAKDLHIPPLEMGKMYFYDIMYLYKAYEDYVTEENKQAQEHQEIYQSSYDLNQMSSEFKMPDYNSITRGITNDISKFNIPKI